MGHLSLRKSRIFLPGLFAGWSALACSPAVGDPLEPLQDHYEGPHGRFFHSSAVAQLPDKRFSLGYSVCNVDAGSPLDFNWDEVGLGTGRDYPLQFATCAVLTKTSPGYAKNDNTRIFFTKRPERWPAKAYLPDYAKGINDILSRLYGTFIKEGASSPRIVDLSVRVIVGPNNRVTYLISWPQGSTGIAVGFNLEDFSSRVREQINSDLLKAGIEYRFIAPKEFFDQDIQRLPSPAQRANYLILLPKVPGPTGVRFSFESSVSGGGSSVIMEIDGTSIVAFGAYSTVR
jgi:hypothetical protein